ncbi:hypothetical protein [Vibrio agarivorans]|nr:hypothetical protein [Vibrio agarivorans]MDN3661154.1 hypothetical protein [Vibrio agarivorans]
MMFKSEEQKRIEKLAKKISKSDKRLSWSNCLRKAQEQSRLFNSHSSD